jgi:hypothetical protein
MREIPLGIRVGGQFWLIQLNPLLILLFTRKVCIFAWLKLFISDYVEFFLTSGICMTVLCDTRLEQRNNVGFCIRVVFS